MCRQWNQATLDLIKAKVSKGTTKKKKDVLKTLPYNTFCVKAIKLISICSIFNNNLIKSILKDYNLDFAISTVVYNLTNPIRS